MNSLQVRLFITYLVIIIVTLSLTALSLLLILGGYRDSITYGSLEDRGLLLNSQANAEIQSAADPGGEPSSGADLLLVLRNFVTDRAAGGVSPETSLAVIDREGRVLEGLWAGPNSLDGASITGLALDDPLAEIADPPPPEPSPQRCNLTPVVGEPLLCVSMPLSRQAIEAFSGSEAAALVIAEPAASLGHVLGDLAPRLVFSGLIGVAAALILGFLLSQSVAAPLRNIARAARNVARGSYSQRVPATGPREVRDLATNFNRMTEEVQRSQQTLRDFLANISHELKTPLTSVRGFSTALLDGTVDSDEERERALRVINSETSRVLRLVEELLALSRLESGQLAMNREPLLLKELFDHIHDVFQLRAEESGIRLQFSERTTSPVFGDFDRLEQVLSNLLDNAFRHTSRGGTVAVAARQISPTIVQVRVSDSGRGIAPEHIPHLFERFYRAEAGSGERRGYGLGLAICREIVRAHGGEIRAESVLGKGTTFAFTLRSRQEAGGRREGHQILGAKALRRRSRPEPEA